MWETSQGQPGLSTCGVFPAFKCHFEWNWIEMSNISTICLLETSAVSDSLNWKAAWWGQLSKSLCQFVDDVCLHCPILSCQDNLFYCLLQPSACVNHRTVRWDQKVAKNGLVSGLLAWLDTVIPQRPASVSGRMALNWPLCRCCCVHWPVVQVARQMIFFLSVYIYVFFRTGV